MLHQMSTKLSIATGKLQKLAASQSQEAIPFLSTTQMLHTCPRLWMKDLMELEREREREREKERVRDRESKTETQAE